MSRQLMYRKIMETIVEKDAREILPPKQKRLEAIARFLEEELEDSSGQTLE